MLSIGIIGLPNVGKSSLFQALTKKQVDISNYPFTTINPNIAVVNVPDARLEKLTVVAEAPKITPATIKFIDIAGLVKDAHKGEGLGNQFLSHIRETNAIIHLVRVFSDPSVSHIHGNIDPAYDIEIIERELKESGLSYLPVIFVFNVDPVKSPNGDNGVDSKDAGQWQPTGFMKSLLKERPFVVMALEKMPEENILNKLIQESFKLLNLITFFTLKGGNELRAWSIKNESTIYEAAGKIHTDFQKKFIKAEVINWEKLIETGSWVKAKEKGFIKLAGRDYLVQEGDVIEIKI